MPDAPAKTTLTDGAGQPVTLTQEALAGGAGFGGLASVASTIALGRYTDEAQRRYGDRIWDHVDKNEAAGSSLDLLCYATLANDIVVVPAVQLDAGKAPDTPEQAADVALSAECAAYVARTLNGLARPIHDVARAQIRGALLYGADVADKVWEVPETGADAGQLVLKAIKPKERRAWAFVVDAFWNLRYVAGYSAGGSGWTLWPREKFCVLTWGGKGGDPRGESVYSRAVEAWNFLAQLPEDHFRFLKRFGTPKVAGKLSRESMQGAAQSLALSPGETRTFNPFAWFLTQLNNWVNGLTLAVGEKDTVEVFDVKSEGQAFLQASDLYERKIVRAILLQVRATVEAKNGSKADSQTSSDVLGNMIQFLRRWYTKSLEWDVSYYLILYRYGPAVAARHTPTVSLGQVEHQDIANLLTGLGHVGYTIGPKQFPSVDKHLGVFAVRTLADIEAETETAADDGSGGQAEQTAPPPGESKEEAA